MKMLKAVVVEPREKARIEEIDATLSSLQKIVGGTIQVIYPYTDEVALICNDNGKIEGLPLNRALVDGEGKIYDIIAGTFVIVGLDDCDFGPLSESLAQKYLQRFRKWEKFCRIGGQIIAIPMDK